MANHVKANIWSYLLITLSFLYGVFTYDSLPDQIIRQISLSGEPVAFYPKSIAVLFLPALALALTLAVPYLIRRSPSQFSLTHSSRVVPALLLTTNGLVCGLHILMIQKSLNPHGPFGFKVDMLLAVFAIFLGNYFAKVERNFFIGIRTPWTLASEKNWRATHRASAKVWVGLGILCLILSLLKVSGAGVIGLTVGALYSISYSYWYFKTRGT